MRRSPLPVIVLLVAALGCAVAAFLAASGSVHGGRPVAADRTPLLSARRAPSLLAASVGDPALRAALDQIVAAGPQATCVSVSVDGRQVYSHQADLPVPPASNQKLVTAAVALEVLGADHRFRTSVVGAAPKGGTVNGDLHLVGGGDPVLSTKAFTAHYPDQPAVGTSLEKLADAVVASGVHHVTGRILGDESRYDTLRTVPTWPDALRRAAPDRARCRRSRSTTASPASPSTRPSENRLDVEATADPAGYAASTFTELLRQRGVQVDGGSGTGVAPAGAHQVAHVDSPRLSAIVGHMLTESDNEVAELLVKELGHRRAGSGTTAAGLTVVREAVRALGLPDHRRDHARRIRPRLRRPAHVRVPRSAAAPHRQPRPDRLGPGGGGGVRHAARPLHPGAHEGTHPGQDRHLERRHRAVGVRPHASRARRSPSPTWPRATRSDPSSSASRTSSAPASSPTPRASP